MGINFPATPTVGQKYPQPAIAGIPVYTWDGEKWTTVGGSIAAYAPPADAIPLMDATPGLVGIATEYAREDHVHPTDTTRAPAAAVAEVMPSALAYSGMQINGGMEVSQEFGLTSRTTNGYVVDGWGMYFGGSMVLASAQYYSNELAGFPSFAFINVDTAQSSLGAGDFCVWQQIIEGYRTARLAWGTASAQPITVSFWSAHNRTGTFSVCIRNGASTRSYVSPYTQAAANVWQYNTITVPGDTTGTWAKDNTAGLSLAFSNGAGSTYIAPSANTWLAGSYLAASGQVNNIASTSDQFKITGVTVLPGTQAPTAAQSPNIMRPYGEELVTCQRYYEKILATPLNELFQAYQYSASFYQRWQFKTEKRAIPTLRHIGGSSWPAGVPSNYPNVDGVNFYASFIFYLSGGGGAGLVADARL